MKTNICNKDMGFQLYDVFQPQSVVTFIHIISRLGSSTGTKVGYVVVCTVSLNVESSELYAKGNDDEQV